MISSGIDLVSHWLEDCANFMPTPEENGQYIQRQPLLMQYKLQANPLLSMNNLYSTCD
jgi:hypothetical protein